MTGNHSKDERYNALLSIVPYDEDVPIEEMQQKLKEARKVVAQVRKKVPHNHFTRDIKPKGVCPACDKYHDKT